MQFHKPRENLDLFAVIRGRIAPDCAGACKNLRAIISIPNTGPISMNHLECFLSCGAGCTICILTVIKEVVCGTDRLASKPPERFLSGGSEMNPPLLYPIHEGFAFQR